tara:strand:- start:1318 stop:1854 length:537 start_codon:yes stop_codon:yes gene_type:complete
MNLDNTKNAHKTYRYKFTENFLAILKEYSRLHRFDDPINFKDNWEIWCDENKKIIEEECAILSKMGYKGDGVAKMYKSSRYYFKNKSNTKKEVKKRRKYVSVGLDFKDAIDNHINNITIRREIKPSEGYINFIDDELNTDLLRLEKLRLESYNFTIEEIMVKFKKTYKNRYFIVMKNS